MVGKLFKTKCADGSFDQRVHFSSLKAKTKTKSKAGILFSIFLILFVLPLFSPVYALDFSVRSRENLKLDESLSDQRTTQYAEPTKILLTQVTTNAEALTYNSETWMQYLYYYTVTRLHFTDIPYNYLIDRNGVIYEGRKGGVGVSPEIEATMDGIVLIGYLSNGYDLTPDASTSLQSIITDYSTKFGIQKDKVEVVDLELSNAEQIALDKKNTAPSQNAENSSDTSTVKLAKLIYKTSTSPLVAAVQTTLADVKFSKVNETNITLESPY